MYTSLNFLQYLVQGLEFSNSSCCTISQISPPIHVLQLYLAYIACIKVSEVSNFNEACKWLLIAFSFENPLSQRMTSIFYQSFMRFGQLVYHSLMPPQNCYPLYNDLNLDPNVIQPCHKLVSLFGSLKKHLKSNLSC